MTYRISTRLAIATASLVLACGCHAVSKTTPTYVATSVNGTLSSDAIDQAWQRALDAPESDSRAGYQTPYHRRNKRASRTAFQKFPQNPILTLGQNHSFDAGHAEYPSIVEVADSLWMFYAAFGSGGFWSIAAATSRDGLHWTKQGSVLEPASDDEDWDSATVAFPQVIYDAAAPPAERFQLYYTAKKSALYHGIGLALSADGINWERYGRILSTGGDQDWDGAQMVDPSVIRVGDGYRMYYCGARSEQGLFKIGLALSADGKEWVKYPDNPVFALQEGQGRGLYTVDVLFTGDRYILFESTPDPEGFYDIYGVLSPDGLTFDSRRRRLVLRASHDSTWDHVMVYGMDALIRDQRAFIWFNGIYRKMVTRGGQIGVARADLGRLLSYLDHQNGPR